MLGVMSAERAAAFPGVPTLREQGLPDLEVETWYAMFVPAGTPASVVARVNGEINELLKEGDVKDVLARQGLAAAGGRPERLGELVKQELTRWTRVVNAAGIKAD
jgi:tripartite-type tricarboxylate transporter receptor subunit TctC